jgi:signal transduction histidine kinase
LLIDGEVMGTLEAGRTDAAAFSELEVAGIDMLAGQASVAIRNARLYDELAESHESLQRAHHELGRTQAKLLQVQRLESIGELAAGIAHEINTPIQYVGDNTRFLAQVATATVRLADAAGALRGAASSGTGIAEAIAAFDRTAADVDLDFLATEAVSAAEQALEGVDRVARIVGAMREFAHPGGAEHAPVDLNRSVATTLQVARNEWKYVAEVVTDLDPDLGTVPGLAGPLNQTILNIVVNAAHAVGEVEKPTGERGRITVTTRRDGSHAVVSISDTGPGIPDDIVDRIFDPFFTTKGVGRGSGQGLAIARNTIVEQHGGDLEVETELGAGTTFTIRIPYDRTEDDS